MVKNPPAMQCSAGDGFHPWVRKIPWRRKWQPTPVLLPGKSHGQRSLVGYSPRGHKRVRPDLATKQQKQLVQSIGEPGGRERGDSFSIQQATCDPSRPRREHWAWS